MLDEEQRRTVLEMFCSGKSISEISRRVGISRPSVYRVIASGVEKDPEILKLKKELRKTELRKKLDKLRKPMNRMSKIDKLDDVVYRLIPQILYFWERESELELPECFYCGGSVEYYEKDVPRKNVVDHGYKCHKCGRTFRLPQKN